jgi:hypothetical protein
VTVEGGDLAWVLTSAAMTFGDAQSTFTCSTILESDQRVHLIGTEGRLLVEIPFNIPPDRTTRLLLTAGETPVDPNTEVMNPAKDQRRAGRITGVIETQV